MNVYFSHIINLIKRLSLIIVLFFITRILFYAFNNGYFNSLESLELLKILIVGLRFDVSSIFYFNTVFILLSIIPINYLNNSIYQKIIKILFVATNTIILLPQFIDIEYFKFTDKRLTADIFSYIGISNDVFALMPRFVLDFWYLLVMWAISIVAVIYFYPKSKISIDKTNTPYYKQFASYLMIIVIVGIYLLGARGTRIKPIRILNAAEYTETHNIPLVLNTPFTIAKTLFKEDLLLKDYFTDKEIDSYYNPLIQTTKNKTFNQKNVVIIILESFSKEYIGFFNNGKGYTPFLDSLIGKSLVFDNAFANGKKSIEAIPAICAAIPSLMENPYITSEFATNKTNSLAHLLKKEGYSTSFFHGGTNGTMGFDYYTKIIDFTSYYGRNQYNNEKDYDGNWGVFDEPFFQYFASQLNSFKAPFFSCIFSLSSHHPYTIPEKHKNEFKGGELEILRSIEYADFSLKEFFETASKMPWFKNTLFVLTADHTAQPIGAFYKNKVGMYNIPIIFYSPNDSMLRGVNHTITQQIDILPTVLDYLNYQKTFLAFGNSALDSTTSHFTANYNNGIYQLIENDFALFFDGINSLELYNIKTDPLLSTNLIKTNKILVKQMENRLKAIIQNYNNRLIRNKLTAESK